ncbi:FtsW/RodA/SpoVE family cell cycle protein [Ileibacterium valens]|uniref:FtsW/RodA/SpoVE family cell cycle protein n=1 Tax=Ileibacterium valens TaxID=1862668 RepID=UPI00272C245E|nr:FtsW/RodA/SpoVE family cell cycle protein [Ileibacterium valens]
MPVQEYSSPGPMPNAHKTRKKKRRSLFSKNKRRKEKKPFMERMLSKLMMKSGSDPWINASVFLLMIFGTIMVISTDLGLHIGEPRQILISIGKQLLYMGAGYLSMVAVSKLFDYSLFKVFQKFLIIVFFGLMICVLIFGTTVYGSKAWLTIAGIISIQPSEFAKPLIIWMSALAVYMTCYYPRRSESFWVMFHDPNMFFIGCALFVMLQHDLGTLTIIFLIYVVCTLVPAEKGPRFEKTRKVQKWIKGIGAVAVICATVFVFVTDIAENVTSQITPLYHVSTRIRNMKDPYADVYNEGYQPANSLYSIGDAGLFGKGIGNSARKYGYLTQADSDYILAVTIEETGILGLGLICVLYLILIGRMFWYALMAKDSYDKVLLVGTAAYLGIHFIINVGGVGALIPMTGVPLLFISAGGTSIVAASLAIGAAQSRIADIRKQNGEI